MQSTHQPPHIHVRAVRHRAGVQYHQIRRLRLAHRQITFLFERPLDRRPIRLRRAAAEALHKDPLQTCLFSVGTIFQFSFCRNLVT